MLQIDEPTLATTKATASSDYDAFLAKLGEFDRQNVRRHMAFCETEPTDDHQRVWKRVACMLAQIAPLAAHTTGQRAVRFFVADGKYRLQLFALEDLRDGNLVVYAGDALGAALEAGAVRHRPVHAGPGAQFYDIGDKPGDTVRIEHLTAASTISAPDYYKHMLGWNRKALKITLPLDASPSSIQGLLAFCALSAQASLRLSGG